MNDFLLVKGDSVAAYAYLQPQIILTQAQAQSIFNRQAFLYACGVVTYRDVFNRLHQTRFGYVSSSLRAETQDPLASNVP